MLSQIPCLQKQSVSRFQLCKNKTKKRKEKPKNAQSQFLKELENVSESAEDWPFLLLFNALINPLLKAILGVSGFVLWPCDYSAINKG